VKITPEPPEERPSPTGRAGRTGSGAFEWAVRQQPGGQGGWYRGSLLSSLQPQQHPAEATYPKDSP